MTEKQPEEKKTSRPNLSPLSKKIIDRLGWGLLIIGLGITLIILVYALSGSLYDGIGPVKLAVLLVGLLFLLAGGVVLILKPASPVEKYQGFLARLTLIKSEIPRETLAKIEPLRFLLHAVGVLGIILIYFYAISDLGFKGFGPLKLAAMGLSGLFALFGFALYLPGIESFALWLSDNLRKLWEWIKQSLAALCQKAFNFIDQIRHDMKRSSEGEKPVTKIVGIVLLRLFWSFFRIVAFILLIVLMTFLLYLIGRELYLTTMPEPLFYKRLIRGLLLGGIIVVVLAFEKIRVGIKQWISNHREKMEQFKQRNAAVFLVALLLVLLVAVGEVVFRFVSPIPLKRPDDVNVYEVVNHLPYNYWDLRNETNHAYLLQDPSGLSYYLSEDYSGQFYNSTDGIRLTIAQPENPDHYIHMVGADLLLALPSPDGMTPSSLLQKKLNEAYDDTYAVVNHSCFAYFSFQSLARLKEIEINRGDIVVFVLGTQDADILNEPQGFNFIHLSNEGIVSSDFVSKITGYAVRPHKLTLENFFIRLNNTLVEHSALYRALKRDHAYYPDQFNSMDEIDHLLSLQAQELGKIVLDAHQYVTESGAELIVVLEPNLYTLSGLSEREKALAYENQALYQVRHRFWTFPLAYDYYRETLQELEAEHSFQFYDLSGSLNSQFREDGQEVYLLWNEILPAGNQIIADELFKAMITVLN